MAEPQQPTVPSEVHDVAVGSDVPEPWYSLPPNVSLQSLLSMVQRNVGVAVRDILQTELGNPALMDNLHQEVMEKSSALEQLRIKWRSGTYTYNCNTSKESYESHRRRKPVNGTELLPG